MDIYLERQMIGNLPREDICWKTQKILNKRGGNIEMRNNKIIEGESA